MLLLHVSFTKWECSSHRESLTCHTSFYPGCRQFLEARPCS